MRLCLTAPKKTHDPAQLVNPFIAALEAAQAQPETYELWHCNVVSWMAWCGVQTQWRRDHAGLVGLDYPGVSIYLDIALSKGSDKQAVFFDLLACERAALDAVQTPKKALPR